MTEPVSDTEPRWRGPVDHLTAPDGTPESAPDGAPDNTTGSATGSATGDTALHDFTAAPRIGFKGPGLVRWLAARGWPWPAENNQALQREDGVLVARLSATEMLALASRPTGRDPGPGTDVAAGAPLAVLERAWQAGRPRDCYPLPRAHSHAAFALTGPAAADCLAGLCAVDFQAPAFPPLSVAQTVLAGVNGAGVNGIVIRADLTQALTGFHILVDRSLAAYLWSHLAAEVARQNSAPSR